MKTEHQKLMREIQKLSEELDEVAGSVSALTKKLNNDSEEVETLASTGLFVSEVPETQNVRVCYSVLTRKAARLTGTNIYYRKGGRSWIRVITRPSGKPKIERIEGREAFDSVPDNLKETAIYNMHLFSQDKVEFSP